MRRPLTLLALLVACNQAPSSGGPGPSATPTPGTTPPPPSLVPPPAPDPHPRAHDPARSAVVWSCSCATRSGGETVTACRSDEAACTALAAQADAGVVTHRCRDVRGDHPGDALGGRGLWRADASPGAWLSTGTCLLPGAPDAPPASDAPPDVLSGESLGDLKLGLSDADVVERLGEPKTKDRPTLQGADGEYHHNWGWPDRGLTLDLVAATKSGPWRVASITAKAPCDRRTSRGVGVGDPRSSVEAAYGKDRARDSEPTDTSFVAGSVHGGVSFTFDPATKNVTEIFLGAGAE